ncbi:MAG: hypothetical protein ACYTEQ_22725 [Planctomycetota bacterium]|jgi:hypothetical protein
MNATQWDGKDFICSCGARIFDPRNTQGNMWNCTSCGTVFVDTARDQHQNTALHLIDAHAEAATLRERVAELEAALEDVTAQRDSLRINASMKRTSAAPTGEPGA